MDRLPLVLSLVALLPLACGPAFKDRRTPSGDFCSDMPIIPAGQDTDREYHRLQPIQSDPKTHTEAERLESLRRVACGVGADAVIEAVNEEVRGDNAAFQTVSSGTAIIWLRRSDHDAPKSSLLPSPKKPTPIGAATADPNAATDPNAPPAPTADPTAAPTSAPAAKTAKPVGGKPPAKKGPTPLKN